MERFYTATGKADAAGDGSASVGGGANKSSCCEDFDGAISNGRIISG